MVTDRWFARQFEWSTEVFEHYLEFYFVNLPAGMCCKVIMYKVNKQARTGVTIKRLIPKRA